MVDWRGEQGSAGFLWQTSSAAHPSGDPLADARLAPSTAGWDPAALATSSSSYQPTEARPEDWDQASLRELLLRADRHGTGKVSREQLLDVLRSDAEARRLLHVPGADGEASLALWAERLLRQLHIPAEGNVPLADLDLLHTPLRGPAGSPAGLGTRVQSMLSHQFSGLATPAQQAGLSAGNTPRGEYAASALARPALSGLAPSGLAPSGLAHSGLAHSMLAHKEEEDAAASAEAVASAAAAAGGSRSPPRPAALDASLVTGGGPPVGKEIEDPHYQQQQQQQPVRRKDNAPFSGHFHKRAPQRGPQRGKSAQQGGVPTAAQNPWQNAYTQPARHVQGRASSQRRPAERPAAPVPAQKAQTRKAALLDGALGREIASMQKLLDAAGA